MRMTKIRNLRPGSQSLSYADAHRPGAVGAASGQTVSDFAVKVYKGSLVAAGAMAALARPRARDSRSDARLTEGSLAGIMNAYGIKSTTGQPGLLVDQGRADAALLFIWQSAAARGGNAGTSGAAGGGQIDLSTCVPDRNIWTCMQCCIQQADRPAPAATFCTFGSPPAVRSLPSFRAGSGSAALPTPLPSYRSGRG